MDATAQYTPSAGPRPRRPAVSDGAGSSSVSESPSASTRAEPDVASIGLTGGIGSGKSTAAGSPTRAPPSIDCRCAGPRGRRAGHARPGGGDRPVRGRLLARMAFGSSQAGRTGFCRWQALADLNAIVHPLFGGRTARADRRGGLRRNGGRTTSHYWSRTSWRLVSTLWWWSRRHCRCGWSGWPARGMDERPPGPGSRPRPMTNSVGRWRPRCWTTPARWRSCGPRWSRPGGGGPGPSVGRPGRLTRFDSRKRASARVSLRCRCWQPAGNRRQSPDDTMRT